ncbi:hypothetical protein QJS10_CPB11g01933 [Acorus calamus]|uniref:Exostosin GT47 domain-containing protein n=1 Tax=Acorus calamus TaxID=4465 RepID=A0AAV9DU44_ACOCL|nr:hypothetical protein QJS10_CPB11g01933 [Acorus calamus]
MAVVSLSRKRSSPPQVTNKTVPSLKDSTVDPPFGHILRQSVRVPPLLLLLLILFFWFSYMLPSMPFFHICISSRKINLYCISGGTQPNFDAIVPPRLVSFTNTTTTTTNTTSSVGKKEEIANAIKVVEEKLQVIRSWASNSSKPRSCDGRGVFVYDLPPKFNKELIEHCRDLLLPWTDFCNYFKNDAKGEPIPSLGDRWFRTHQYSLEPIFHSRLLKHPCRVRDEAEAKLFYVPFYAGLDALRWHFKSNVSGDVKDSLGVQLVSWLETSSKWWARNSGADHVFVLGKISWDFRRRDEGAWGTRLLELRQMRNTLKLLIERHPWETNDIGVPHPTYFHPKTDDDVRAWQARIISSARTSLASFVGAARPDAEESIRSALIEQCESSSGECRFLDCGTGACANPEAVIGVFKESEFCMQPPGDSPTRRSVFDGLISGCIPVLFDPFTAYYQYPWHLPEERGLYSVFVDKEEVREGKVNVMERLRRVSKKERDDMRRYIVYELMPRLVYADSDSEMERFDDAFDVAMEGLFSRISRLEL